MRSRQNHQLAEKIINKSQKGLPQLEKLLKELTQKQQLQQIRSIAQYFIFLSTHTNQNPTARIATIRSLQCISYCTSQHKKLKELVPNLISPVLLLLHDPNEKVRFTCISSLYNIFTLLGNDCLPIITRTFKELIVLVTDPSPQVRQANFHLNHTMKSLLNDAILDNLLFNVKDFMEVLIENFKLGKAQIQQFLIDWINSLDEITQFEMSPYLPQILRELFKLLESSYKSAKNKSYQCLKGFIVDFRETYDSKGNIHSKMSLDVAFNVVEILISLISENISKQITFTALEWIDQFTQFLQIEIDSEKQPYFQVIFMRKFKEIMKIVLDSVGSENAKIKEIALAINEKLLKAFPLMDKHSVQFRKIQKQCVTLLPDQLRDSYTFVKTQVVIKWLKMTIKEGSDNQAVYIEMDTILQRIAEKLCEKNGKSVITLIENSIFTNNYFQLLISVVLTYIYRNPQINIDPILRGLATIPDSVQHYFVIVRRLEKYQNLVFKYHIIDYLINVLITQKQLREVRSLLMNHSKQNQSLFYEIFKFFACNEAAIIALCFLCEMYDLLIEIFRKFSEEENLQQTKIPSLLKIVNLLQCPSMNHLTLRFAKNDLLSYKAKKAYLSFVMILPSGKATNMLTNRVKFTTTKNRGPPLPLTAQQEKIEAAKLKKGRIAYQIFLQNYTDYIGSMKRISEDRKPQSTKYFSESQIVFKFNKKQ